MILLRLWFFWNLDQLNLFNLFFRWISWYFYTLISFTIFLENCVFIKIMNLFSLTLEISKNRINCRLLVKCGLKLVFINVTLNEQARILVWCSIWDIYFGFINYIFDSLFILNLNYRILTFWNSFCTACIVIDQMVATIQSSLFDFIINCIYINIFT